MKKNKTKDTGYYGDIYAIILATLAVFLLLSLFTDYTGIVGHYTAYFLSWLLGWGRFLLPFLLLTIAGVILVRKDIYWNDIILGLTLIGVSLLAQSHVLVPINQMYSEDYLIRYGGFLGFLFSYPLVYLLKPVGATVILVGVLLIGFVLTVRRPLTDFVRLGKKRPAKSPLSPAEIPAPQREPEVTFVEETLPVSLDEKTVPINVPINKQLNQKKTESLRELVTVPLEIIKKEGAEKYLLCSSGKKRKSASEMKAVLEKTLKEFEVGAWIENVREGPTFTRFEIQLEPGVKVSKILRIEEDMALALASPDLRILAPIPGKSAIGIEVPNVYRSFVYLGDLVKTPEFQEAQSPLAVAIGQEITGAPVVIDLKGLPHLLIAGATGSGKSVCLNAIITSILLRARPDEVKFIMIDPKRIELNIYNDIPHLIVPVVVNPKQAAAALNWAVEEMERRFELLSETKTRHLDSYNREAQEELPYLVIVLDELADLMIIAAKEVEDAICRLAQMGRAVGIHLVVATQRPSSDIITGLIKANITSRIAFAVSSQVDSRVILDSPGAEKLVGKGDMLFLTPSWLKPHRLQGVYVSEGEIEKVVEYWKAIMKPQYDYKVTEVSRLKSFDLAGEDTLFDEAAELVIVTGKASVTYLQRKFKLGYARAARLMDLLEERGIVGPAQGSRPREVLLTLSDWEEIKHSQSKEESQ